MYDAIAAYQEVFLYFSVSILAVGIGLGGIVTLAKRHYRFTMGNADIFVHKAVLQAYVEHYSHQTFPFQKTTVKIRLNRRNQIAITLDLLKQINGLQDLEQIEKDLTELFFCRLGYQKPLFLEITYK